MKTIIVAFSSLMACSFAVAQTTPAVNQASTAGQHRELRQLGMGDTVPALYAEEDEDLGPQAVLRKRKPTWFRATADAQVFYTDNVFFTDRGEREAAVGIATLEAALTTPACITRFASYRAEAGYRHQFFSFYRDERLVRGLEVDDFNFDSSTLFADVVAQTRHYQFRAGFDYTRLLGFEPLREDDYERFYREYVPRWSVQRNIRVCDRSMVSLAYLGSYHFASEDPPVIFSAVPPNPALVRRLYPRDRSERWEHAFLAAYTVTLPFNLVAQPYYRYQFTDFANDRDSHRLHTAGFGLGWIPCENFAVRTFVNGNWQRSDTRADEYSQVNAGAGVNVTARF